MPELVIRRAGGEDVPAIAEMERRCFSVPWSHKALYEDIVENPRSLYILAEMDGRPAGYAGVWKILDEGHITNVAVLPAFRRQHIARDMLSVLMDICRQSGVIRFTLEVRAGNLGARKLYEDLGFVSAGVRRGYYDDNGEDAVIMWTEAAGPPRETGEG